MDELRSLVARQLKTAWQHRWAALALAWVVSLAGWAVVYRMPNQYEADARLYVDADAVLGPLLRGIAAETEPLSQIDILQRTLLSRPNLGTLIEKTDLELSLTDSSARDRLITRLANDIKIRPETRNLFSIVYRDRDPKRAAEVVQALLTIFIESATGGNRTDMNNARRFLDHQIASYEQQLRSAEKRRAEFKAKYLGLLGDGGSSGLDQARGAVHQLNGQIVDTEARRDQLKKELEATSPLLVVEGGGGGPGGLSEIETAKQQLREMKLRYTDAHPDVVALEHQIAVLAATPGSNAAPGAPGAPARGARSLPNPVYEQIKTRLVDTETTLNSLRRQQTEAVAGRDDLEKSAHAAPGVQADFEALDRDYNILRRNYEELLGRRESASIAQAADTQADKVKLKIIDPPQVPRVPVAPNRVLLTTGVLAAGFGAGFGLAFLLAQLDRSFRTVDDLRSLGLTVLGGISAFKASASRKAQYAGLLAFCAGCVMLVAVYGGLVSRMARTLTAA